MRAELDCSATVFLVDTALRSQPRSQTPQSVETVVAGEIIVLASSCYVLRRRKDSATQPDLEFVAELTFLGCVGRTLEVELVSVGVDCLSYP